MPGVPLLDELMANAWRPAIVETRGNWRYRWADGLTRRANSALALDAGADTGGLLDLAETFYREPGAPTLVQVSSASAPPDLVTILHERGYRPSARTLVQVASTSEVAQRTKPMFETESTSEPTDEWFHAYWSIDSIRGRSDKDAAVCRNFLLAPGLPTAFAAVRHGREVVGVGQIVIERGWAGVQCMATAPFHRRRGVANAALHGLAEEAVDHGVESMYLAVMAENEGATELYERNGFRTVHEYCYFTESCSFPRTS